jgi:hypothetical protein
MNRQGQPATREGRWAQNLSAILLISAVPGMSSQSDPSDTLQLLRWSCTRADIWSKAVPTTRHSVAQLIFGPIKTCPV